MKRFIYIRIMAVLAAVLLCTACGGDQAAEQRAQKLETVIAAAEEEAASLKEMLQNESLTQMEMNEVASAVYTVWDDALNTTWGMLQETLDEETMAQLQEEQRDWIAQKEAAVQAASAEVEGGSMYSMVVNSEAAEQTKERVYALAEYLQ